MDLGVPINNVLNVKLFHVLFIPEQCAILITCIMLFSWPMLNLFTRHFKIPSWSPFDCINLSLLNSFFFFCSVLYVVLCVQLLLSLFLFFLFFSFFWHQPAKGPRLEFHFFRSFWILSYIFQSPVHLLIYVIKKACMRWGGTSCQMFPPDCTACSCAV